MAEVTIENINEALELHARVKDAYVTRHGNEPRGEIVTGLALVAVGLQALESAGGKPGVAGTT